MLMLCSVIRGVVDPFKIFRRWKRGKKIQMEKYCNTTIFFDSDDEKCDRVGTPWGEKKKCF